MEDEAVVALVSVAMLIAGVVVIVVGLNYRARMRELRHKERLAMIEKGLLPPPEFDLAPAGSAPASRSRSLGIIIVGLGFALMFLIGIAGGAVDAGIGVGGAIAIVGAAFIVRSIYGGPPASTRRPEPPPASTGSSLLP